MTLNPELWKCIRCVICAVRAEHTLEVLLGIPTPTGCSTLVVVGFCSPHYEEAKRTPQWKDLQIVEATALEPKGVG